MFAKVKDGFRRVVWSGTMSRRQKVLRVLFPFLMPIALWLVLLGGWWIRSSEFDRLIDANLPTMNPAVEVGIWTAKVDKSEPQQLTQNLAWDRHEDVGEDVNNNKNHIFQAVEAGEDERFESRRRSPDFEAKARAFWSCLTTSAASFSLRCPEGGSTITEQLVKNVVWDKPPRTFVRKITETGLARKVEARWSKSKIITRYINEAYLGDGEVPVGRGFQSAAKGYFGGKSLADLEVHESALLAGMLPNPSKFSPFKNPKAALERRNRVLDKMAELGFISRADANAAKAKPLGVKKGTAIEVQNAPHFARKVARTISDVTGGAVSEADVPNLRVETSLDFSLQQHTYDVYRAAVENLRKELRAKGVKNTQTLQASFVFVDRDGYVRSYFGSASYKETQYDFAGDKARQPGSAVKPVVYGELLKQQKGNKLWLDTPSPTGWPHNFHDEYLQRELAWPEALWRSKNVITVNVAKEVGLQAVVDRMVEAGLPKQPANASAVLGTKETTALDLAGMMLMFANSGQWKSPKLVTGVTRADGTSVPISYPGDRQVFDDSVTGQVVEALRQVVHDPSGTAHRIDGKLSVDVFGKTGTTQTPDGKEKDAWFVGCVPGGCGAVWVGFPDNRPILVTGGATAAPIWAAVMKKMLQVRPSYKDGSFPTGTIAIEPEQPSQEAPSEEEASEASSGQGSGSENSIPASTPCDKDWRRCAEEREKRTPESTVPRTVPAPVATPKPACGEDWKNPCKP